MLNHSIAFFLPSVCLILKCTLWDLSGVWHSRHVWFVPFYGWPCLDCLAQLLVILSGEPCCRTEQLAFSCRDFGDSVTGSKSKHCNIITVKLQDILMLSAEFSHQTLSLHVFCVDLCVCLPPLCNYKISHCLWSLPDKFGQIICLVHLQFILLVELRDMLCRQLWQLFGSSILPHSLPLIYLQKPCCFIVQLIWEYGSSRWLLLIFLLCIVTPWLLRLGSCYTDTHFKDSYNKITQYIM